MNMKFITLLFERLFVQQFFFIVTKIVSVRLYVGVFVFIFIIYLFIF